MLGYEGCGYLLRCRFQSTAFCPLNLKDSYLSHKQNTFIPFGHSRVSTHCSIKSRISSKSHHLNQVEVRLWVWSILGKNFCLWAWETRKRVMCSQNTVVGHAKYDCHGHSQIQKGGDIRNKCVAGPRQFQNSAGKISQVVMPGSNLLWLGTLPSGPVALASGPKSQFFELSLLFLEG